MTKRVLSTGRDNTVSGSPLVRTYTDGSTEIVMVYEVQQEEGPGSWHRVENGTCRTADEAEAALRSLVDDLGWDEESLRVVEVQS